MDVPLPSGEYVLVQDVEPAFDLLQHLFAGGSGLDDPSAEGGEERPPRGDHFGVEDVCVVVAEVQLCCVARDRWCAWLDAEHQMWCFHWATAFLSEALTVSAVRASLICGDAPRSLLARSIGRREVCGTKNAGLPPLGSRQNWFCL